ncbi:redoxin domain-containing protein, partial [Spirillospora sp. NPDC049652]
MEFLVAGLVLVTTLTALNLVLTVAVVRRWRARVGASPAAHAHPHDHGHGFADVPPHVDREPELGIVPGDRMPAFSAATTGGGTVTADDLSGRPALVAFLSLDCTSCDESVPEFAERARRVRDAGGRVLATVVG